MFHSATLAAFVATLTASLCTLRIDQLSQALKDARLKTAGGHQA